MHIHYELVELGENVNQHHLYARDILPSNAFQRLLYLKKLDGYPVIRNVEVAEEEETDEVLQMDEIDRMANEGDEEEVEDAEKGEEEEEDEEDDEEEGEDDDVDSQNSSAHED